VTDLAGLTPSLAEIDLVIFDFDGVFTDNTVIVSQDGVESVRCWRSDGLGLSRITDIGVRVAIVSTEKNPVVSTRAQKLRIPCFQGVDRKDLTVLRICGEFGVAVGRTMFVGNDINDIVAFQTIGFPVAVADAYPEVLPHVRARTIRAGGRGAVREICDLIFQAKQGVRHEPTTAEPRRPAV
jgi:YrbI family 3-deoxy-D-manno-octulosonate 8-phosphate phosphatase